VLEADTFDLVLMDVQMPELDGLATTEAIRRREAEIRAGAVTAARGSAYADPVHAGRRIPIVALTAHAMKSDEERCFAAGMAAHPSNPATADALARTLARFAPATAGAPPESVVDRAAGLRGVDGDAELFAEVTGLFVDEWPARQEELRAALGDAAR